MAGQQAMAAADAPLVVKQPTATVASIVKAERATGHVDGEGPVEHIRNALQIVNGMSYLLATMKEHPGGYYADVPTLVRESTEGLELRLSIALAQLLQERATRRRRPTMRPTP